MFRPNPDRINIRHLAVETPAPREELPFDPERDITEKDIRGMETRLEQLGSDRNDGQFLVLAVALKVFSPSSFVRIGVMPTAMMRNLKNYWFDKEWHHLVEYGADAKELVSAIDPPVDDNALRGIAGELAKDRAESWWRDFASTAAAIKRLKLPIDIQLDEEVRKGMRQHLDQYRHRREWGRFAKCAV